MAVINGAQSAIQWFKSNFLSEITEAVKGTPFTPEMVCAIAYQETGYIWLQLVNKGLTKEEVLYLCVGDTLDKDRVAFPRTAEILKASYPKIFIVARKAVVEMAKYVAGMSFVNTKPNKFAHGFGIFQYDIQFCKENPTFFEQEKWSDFSECLKLLIGELKAAQSRQGLKSKTSLTHEEKVYICIAYNKGKADVSKGFKQGHKSDDGKYYGENIDKYIKLF